MSNGKIRGFEEDLNKFRYLYLGSHSEMHGFIVNTDKQKISGALNDYLSISLRTDASIDRMKIQNNHFQAKVVHQGGSS